MDFAKRRGLLFAVERLWLIVKVMNGFEAYMFSWGPFRKATSRRAQIRAAFRHEADRSELSINARYHD
jgi:hypothetical protein